MLLVVVAQCFGSTRGADYTHYVDPFIGTAGHGHCFPGATVPHGLVQLSPDTRDTGWDACGGYHYDDSTILGFSHTHISGTGVEELGDLLIMPMIGPPLLAPGAEAEPESGYRSRFSHQSEIAVPGYYRVHLDDYDIDVEVTATHHAGMFRIAYPRSKEKTLILDINHGLDRTRRYGMPETLLDAALQVEDATTISGYRISSGWADLQEVYFVIEFSKPILAQGMYDAILQRAVPGLRSRKGSYSALKPDVRGYVTFSSEDNDPLMIRVGVSTTSIAAARRNLHQEIADWDFDALRQQARIAWQQELEKIEIEASDRAKKIFYTAMYHLHIAPNQIADVDGTYIGVDHRPGTTDRGYYSTLSLWDTFRAVHPLYTIVCPDLAADIVHTMLLHHERQGYLPIWTAWGKETHCMIGNHAVPVIVDAALKELRGVDPNRAYTAIAESLRNDHHGSPFSILDQHGYLPTDLAPWSVSATLEMAYDDACAARLAEKLSRPSEAAFFAQRAQNYQRLYDPSSGWMRGRTTSRDWVTPFEPQRLAHGSDYKEGSAEHYSWFVPHDVEGLVGLMGSRRRFGNRLEDFFANSPKDAGLSEVNDVTGFLGRYAHGNEVCHHVAYLFNAAGMPSRTQHYVAEVRERFYDDAPDGIVGNEDCGQMSAWYVFSALGFYPLDPASGKYEIGTPAFAQAVIHLPSGRNLLIEAPGVSTKNRRVRRVTLNGEQVADLQLTHESLMRGGTLRFEMVDTTDTQSDQHSLGSLHEEK